MLPFKKQPICNTTRNHKQNAEDLEDGEFIPNKSEHEMEEEVSERSRVEKGQEDLEDGEFIPDKSEHEMEEEVSERSRVEKGQGRSEKEHVKKESHNVVKVRQKRKKLLEVFVGGLDRDTKEDDLRKVFQQVGEITDVTLSMDPLTQKNKGFAFIRFATVEQSRHALVELRQPVINGKQCEVNLPQNSDTLFVENICKSWSKEKLKEKLVCYGVDKFEELTLIKDGKNEGLNRGIAFLDFPSRVDALEAFRCFQERDLVFGTNRFAKVDFAEIAQVTTVFIDNLPAGWDEEVIRNHIKEFGRIEEIKLFPNKRSARRSNFGIITFNTHDAAISCVEAIQDSDFVYGSPKVKLRAKLSMPHWRRKCDDYIGGRGLWRDDGVACVDDTFSRSRGFVGASSESHSCRDDDGRYGYMKHGHDRRIIRSNSPYYNDRSRDLVGASSERQCYRDDARRYEHSSSYYDSSSSRGYSTIGRLKRPYSEPVEPRSRYAKSSSRQQPKSRLDYESNSDGVHERQSCRDGGGRRYGYIEHDSSYYDSSIRSLKRPYSATVEPRSRYAESSSRQPKSRLDYGSNSDILNEERFNGNNSNRLLLKAGRLAYVALAYIKRGRSFASHSHGSNDSATTLMKYIRGEIGRDDSDERYSDHGREHEPRDYIPKRR